MKHTCLLILLFITTFCFSQENQWIETEGEITEITVGRGRRPREHAMVKFKLENGTEQIGMVELFRIPFIGSMKSVGDKITVTYNKSNPAMAKTNSGKFISDYGLYIFIFLGIIFSLGRIFKMMKRS